MDYNIIIHRDRDVKHYPNSGPGWRLLNPSFFLSKMTEKNRKSFKEEVRQTLFQVAPLFHSYFSDKKYLIVSQDFKNRPYYIIAAKDINFLHLTGLDTHLNPYTFFKSCEDQTLTTDDFKVSYITKYGIKMDKDTIKAKISVLPDIIDIFNKEIMFEEDFSKGQYVTCGIAVGEGVLTLGFVVRQNCRPETLLKGNYIHHNKVCKPSLIMSAPGGATTKFDTIILGNENEIKKNINEIETLISDDILGKLK